MATVTPQQCWFPASARPSPLFSPLRLGSVVGAAASFRYPRRRTVATRKGRTVLACSTRCTLETAGPGFDPLGLYKEGPSRSDSQSPLSTFFGILSPVFGSSSGTRKEKSSYGRGAAGALYPGSSRSSLVFGLVSTWCVYTFGWSEPGSIRW